MPVSATGLAGGPGNIFGSAPGPIATPNPYGNLSSVYPNLTGTNAAASSALMSELQGVLSPQTMDSIHNAAALFGVGSGMPGSGLMSNNYAKNIGLTTEGLQHQGLADYSGLIPAVSSTQTVNPATQAEISATNAQNAAAPNPSAIASYAQTLFDKYLNKLSGPAGGRGAYSGTYSGASSNLPWYAQAANTTGSGWGPAASAVTTHTPYAPGIF